jgi:putative DNA methylase
MAAYKKKLIEVALPLDAINAEGRRDKSLNRGHPKALHWWWARRPLAVCRAIIFAQLVDDPSSHPDRFPTVEAQERERDRLFALMRELVRWERSSDRQLMQQAYEEIANCYEGSPPAVVDPFCGGGSIPMEARRLGLTAVGADINPVAALLTAAMIQLPAPFEGRQPINPGVGQIDSSGGWNGSQGIASDVAFYGERMIEIARERVGALYESDRGGLEEGDTPLAWLWARTVLCPNPACGGVIPLVNSFWLSRSTRRNESGVWAKPTRSSRGAWVEFSVGTSGQPPQGTVFGRNNVRCLLCDALTTVDYVKDEGAAGRMGQQLLGVSVSTVSRKRAYRAGQLEPTLRPDNGGPFLTEEVTFHPQYLQLPRYGFRTFDSLYRARQLALLACLVESLGEIRERADADGAEPAYRDALLTYLGFFIDRVAARNCGFSFWHPGGEKVESAVSTNYFPMRWSTAEANPFADASGGLSGQLKFLVDAIGSLPTGPAGLGLQRDAIQAPAERGAAFCTDPPYFDNIPYADLSDFYYVLLKRSLASVHPDFFSTILTPKADELVADSQRHGGREAATEFFRGGFRGAFDRMIDASHPETPIVVYYAFRQREDAADGGLVSTGWEAMLQSLVDSRLAVTATWPVRTEQRGGLRTQGRNALASSVAIACRPLREDAPLASAREFVAALRSELPEALRRLQRESVEAVDLAMAAIGPGMAIFSRYTRVLEADGSKLPVRRALQLINQVLGELLAEQDSELDAFTQFAVAWYEQYGLAEGPFGDVETLCKAKNVALDGLLVAGIVAARPGRVRLLNRDEFDVNWDPATDQRLTVWEVTQHLARTLQAGGEPAAADLLRRVGGLGAIARDLAYRLYDVSERRGLAAEANAYNGLVRAWREIERIAASESTGVAQQELEV